MSKEAKKPSSAAKQAGQSSSASDKSNPATLLAEAVAERDTLRRIIDAMPDTGLAKALLDSEVHNKAVLAAMPDLMFGYSREGEILYYNAPDENDLYQNPEEFLGKKIDDVLPDNVGAKYRDFIRRTLETGQLQPFEYQLSVPKGVQDFECRMVVSGPDQVLAIVRNITEHKQAVEALQKAHDELEQKVKDRTAQLRALAKKLTQAEQDERRRIVAVLHENVQQMLVGARYTLGRLGGSTAKAERESTIEEVSSILGKALELTRSLSVELRPPVLYEAGLGPALQWLADQLKVGGDLAVGIQGAECGGLASDSVREFLFGAVRELLFNVVRHAGVKEAQVRMVQMQGNRLRIEVKDAGTGFDVGSAQTKRDALGLFSIRERVESLGGRMQVVSAPGRGTTVRLTVPPR